MRYIIILLNFVELVIYGVADILVSYKNNSHIVYNPHSTIT